MSIRSIKGAATKGFKVGNLGQDKTGEDVEEKKYKTCTDLDDILAIIGSRGRYQKIFLYAILSPLTAMEPLLGLNLLFMVFEPDHWCRVPGRNESGLSVDAWKNMTIPRDSGGDFSKCEMFDENRTSVKCRFGWEYDLTDYDHTIPSDFDWVCDKGQYATWVLTANAVGNAIGTIVLGSAADRIGRKPVFIVTLALNIFGRIASLYVIHSIWMFLAFAVITGLGFPMIYIAPAMIGAEFSDKEFRAWIYSFTWMTWVGGMARWLLSEGKVEKVMEVLKNIAKVNGTSDKLTDQEMNSMIKQVIIHQDQSNQNHSVVQLFSKRRLAKNTIMITISWIMNGVIYYAITLNTSNLSGNQFLNFFILAMIEVPAGYFGSVLCDKIGRRWTQVLFFLVGLIASLCAGIAAGYPLIQGWKIFSVISAVIAKFCVTLTFLVVYLQATEIFPTPLRSTGNGFASTAASIIGIFTPYIVFLAKYHLGAPWFVVAGMSLIGVISSSMLPETLNMRLPETLEEAEQFGKGKKFWSFKLPVAEEAPESGK